MSEAHAIGHEVTQVSLTSFPNVPKWPNWYIDTLMKITIYKIQKKYSNIPKNIYWKIEEKMNISKMFK
jgi:hypothetical protein